MHPTFITGNDLYLPLLVKILFCAMRTGDGDASAGPSCHPPDIRRERLFET